LTNKTDSSLIAQKIKETDTVTKFIFDDGREVIFNRFSLKWAVLGVASEVEIMRVKTENEVKLSKNLYYRLEQSTKCNLNCEYCCVKRNFIYEELGEADAIMSVDLANSLLDQYEHEANNIGQEKRVVYFYGEEPFAGWETLKEMLADNRFEFFVNTNGLLLDDEKLSYLSKPHVYTIFSLDGLPEHNQLRFKNIDDYNLLINNYQKLRKLGGRAGFSITVHRDNECDLVEIIETFISKYKPDGIGLGLPMYYATGDTATSDVNIPGYVETLKNLFAVSVKNDIFLPYVASKFRPLINGLFRKYWCEAIGNTRTFLPSGREILCSRLSAKMDISKDELENWTPLNNPHCSKCDSIGICGGGCPWSANMWFENHIDERECLINRRLLPFFLRQLSDVASSAYEKSLEERFKMVAWPK